MPCFTGETLIYTKTRNQTLVLMSVYSGPSTGSQGAASRTDTAAGLPRKRGAGGTLAGTYTSKRANLGTDLFMMRGNTQNQMGGEPPRGALPGGNVAGSLYRPMNFRNVPVRFDPTGGNYSDANARVAIGGDDAAKNAGLNRTALGGNLRPPAFGTNAPNLAQWEWNNVGLAEARGMPSLRDFAIRDQTPTNRNTIEWRGFPNDKPAYFDSYNPARERLPVNMEGSSSTSLFIQQQDSRGGDAGAITQTSPFPNYPYDDAAAKVSTSSKDFGVNPQAKYTVTLTPEAASYAHTELFHMAMFMSMDIAKAPRKNVGINDFGKGRIVPLHSVYSLAVMNFLLHCSQPMPKTRADVLSAADVKSLFGFVGFAIAETGATNTRYTDRGPAPARTRNAVLQFLGETVMYNYAGQIGYGHWWGWIIIGVPTENIFALNSEEYGTYNIAADDPNRVEACVGQDEVSQLSRCPLQYIPWWDRKGNARRPTMKELMYIDDFGLQRIGIYEEVGFITDVMDLRDNATISRTPFSANAAINSGALRVNLHVKRGIKSSG
jgi:hypothetical protein